MVSSNVSGSSVLSTASPVSAMLSLQELESDSWSVDEASAAASSSTATSMATLTLPGRTERAMSSFVIP